MFFKNIWKTFNEKVLIEINSLLEEGIYPSIWKIAGRMSKANSLRSIQLATDKLEEDGYIVKDEERKISSITEIWMELLGTWEKMMRNVFNAFNIPILWSVACGLPTIADASIEWYLSVSSDIVSSYSKEEYFILRADGDSMNELWINQGDLLLIRNKKICQ
jgi:repressor LexA